MKQKKAKSGKRKRIVLFILMFTLVVGIVGVYLIRSRGQRETTQSEEKGFFRERWFRKTDRTMWSRLMELSALV